MIRIAELWHHYGTEPTLRGIDLTVEPGELLCVMGPNGMGKSTLLGCVAGTLAPVKGCVEIDGLRRRRSVAEEKRIRQRLVYLPDQPWTPANHSGREFLFAVGRLYGVEEDRLFDHVQRLLELFDLGSHADRPIRSYSTGQRKKIGICSALVTEAPILVLDEPFSGGLDSSALLALQMVLRELARRREVTVMMAVPVPELVENVADRIAVLKDGEIIACHTPAGLREQTGADRLGQALESFVHPEGLEHISRYFGENGG